LLIKNQTRDLGSDTNY